MLIHYIQATQLSLWFPMIKIAICLAIWLTSWNVTFEGQGVALSEWSDAHFTLHLTTTLVHDQRLLRRNWKQTKKAIKKNNNSSGQSYQTLIYLLLGFSLLSLSVCSIRKYCLYFEMAKPNRKKLKKSTNKLFFLIKRSFFCFLACLFYSNRVIFLCYKMRKLKSKLQKNEVL